MTEITLLFSVNLNYVAKYVRSKIIRIGQSAKNLNMTEIVKNPK